MVMNITDRKLQEAQLLQALEQAQELNELKSRFISMASHEFRTPLAVMQTASDALSGYRQRMTDVQIDMRLDKIRQQIGHMKTVMNKLLDLARHQAGYVDFNPTINDLGALCREIIEEFASQPQHHNRIAYTENLTNPLILFDAHLMRQVVSNLIHNALKYSAPDQPIEVSLKQTESEVSLQVKDRGIGIPATDLVHLFKPFHRAANVGTIPGTGLGLSIIDQAVSAHQGSIKVESEVDQGTTFTVTIPR
jgi:signal transduction histidine kinase